MLNTITDVRSYQKIILPLLVAKIVTMLITRILQEGYFSSTSKANMIITRFNSIQDKSIIESIKATTNAIIEKGYSMFSIQDAVEGSELQILLSKKQAKIATIQELVNMIIKSFSSLTPFKAIKQKGDNELAQLMNMSWEDKQKSNKSSHLIDASRIDDKLLIMIIVSIVAISILYAFRIINHVTSKKTTIKKEIDKLHKQVEKSGSVMDFMKLQWNATNSSKVSVKDVIDAIIEQSTDKNKKSVDIKKLLTSVRVVMNQIIETIPDEKNIMNHEMTKVLISAIVQIVNSLPLQQRREFEDASYMMNTEIYEKVMNRVVNSGKKQQNTNANRVMNSGKKQQNMNAKNNAKKVLEEMRFQDKIKMFKNLNKKVSSGSYSYNPKTEQRHKTSAKPVTREPSKFNNKKPDVRIVL